MFLFSITCTGSVLARIFEERPKELRTPGVGMKVATFCRSQRFARTRYAPARGHYTELATLGVSRADMITPV